MLTGRIMGGGGWMEKERREMELIKSMKKMMRERKRGGGVTGEQGERGGVHHGSIIREGETAGACWQPGAML